MRLCHLLAGGCPHYLQGALWNGWNNDTDSVSICSIFGNETAEIDKTLTLILVSSVSNI